ncbi:MAG TPA: hypothetical protein VHW23_42835 [Kofleriaceae bacterium]|jgi:hypothetical protein|nr:hypothetical protein [Kofleriaceae bacterium]
MRAPWITLAIAACGSPDPAPETLALTVCSAPPCTAPADGQTTIPVAVCVTGSDPLPPALSLTLVLSRSTWEHPSDPMAPDVLVAPIGGIIRCAYASAVAPTDLAPLFIDAALNGFTARTCVRMTAPPIERLLLSSSPTTLTFQQPTTLALSAMPFGPSGARLPASTEVTFTVPMIGPSGARYALQPQPATVAIGATGTATATVITDWTTTGVVIQAEAVVPPSPPCPSDTGAPGTGAAGATFSSTLAVPLLPPPPDAGVPDAM